jgi:hypothetical protein
MPSGRYTHRVAIANSRLVATTDDTVSFRWKDYRHAGRRKVMTLGAGEFMRRFLLHVLPPGFHRIRHFGFLANGARAARLGLCRHLLAAPVPDKGASVGDTASSVTGAGSTTVAFDNCPCCGSPRLLRSALPRAPPPEVPMTADPANAVHAALAPETSTRVALPVSIVAAPTSRRPLRVSRGSHPSLFRSIARRSHHARGPGRTHRADPIDCPAPSHHYRLETLHP